MVDETDISWCYRCPSFLVLNHLFTTDSDSYLSLRNYSSHGDHGSPTTRLRTYLFLLSSLERSNLKNQNSIDNSHTEPIKEDKHKEGEERWFRKKKKNLLLPHLQQQTQTQTQTKPHATSAPTRLRWSTAVPTRRVYASAATVKCMQPTPCRLATPVPSSVTVALQLLRPCPAPVAASSVPTVILRVMVGIM